MIRKHPIRFFLFVLLIQVLLVFSLNVMARSEEIPEASGYFSLQDIDGNSIPDHLLYSVQVDPQVTKEGFWLCGELQAVIDGEWQTIAYSGRQFCGTDVFRQNSPHTVGDSSLSFYGGEIRRLKVNGPFRLLVKVKGVGFEEQRMLGFSPSYQYTDFEASDLVWTQGEIKRISEVVKFVAKWAKTQGIPLGDLEEVTYNFDRWRLDYQGLSAVHAKRVWVEPGGEIRWVNKG